MCRPTASDRIGDGRCFGGWWEASEAGNFLINAGSEDAGLVIRVGEGEDVRLVRREANNQCPVMAVVEMHMASGVTSHNR